jgi:hypothetical protein
MCALPRIISVDDHVIEPMDLWTDRVPAKYYDRAPRIERKRGTPTYPAKRVLPSADLRHVLDLVRARLASSDRRLCGQRDVRD